MTPRILVMAGEPSGDLHGSRVIESLRRLLPEADIDCIGGRRMAATGAGHRRDIDDLAAMGVVEVVHKIPAHLGLLRELRKDFAAGMYQLVILIDYPGFHLRVAEAARGAGVPVMAYVAPQLWAWGEGRARRWAAAVDRLAVILPFEADFFGRHGMDAVYVGHPLLDSEPLPDRDQARARLGIADDATVLALFPGSRRGEVERIWPAFRDAARRLADRQAIDRILVASTPAGAYPGPDERFLFHPDPADVLAASDVAMAKSGTTTLQAAIAGVPMVVGYRTHPLTHLIARRLVKVQWVSLVNLVAGRAVVPELVQGDLTVDRLEAAAVGLLDPASTERIAQLAGFDEVRRRLGSPGASDRVAGMAAEMLAT